MVIALSLAFFGVLFLQSGWDKVADRKGNLDWLTGHFSQSPLKSMVPMLLSTLTLLELASGLVSSWAGVGLFVPVIAFPVEAALVTCGVTLLCLFAGQRIAKDYAGAASIATYFGVLLVAYIASSLG